jgi:hypothetical protein
MLKRIPKSDISIRPFKAYKEWNFTSGSTQIDLLIADKNSSDLSIGNNLSVQKNSLYGQLRAQFYNGHEDNPFLRFGNKNNEYNNTESTKDRFLSGSAKVISIPQIYVGETIKKGSVYVLDGTTEFVDDGYGNLIAAGAGSQILFNYLELTGSTFNFTDIAGGEYSSSISNYFVDINTGEFTISLGNPIKEFVCEITSMDIQDGIIFVKNATFLEGAAGTNRAGNVFYSQGLLVFTRNVNSSLNSNWEISFKSTQTIYEHEYLLIAEQDEFNISTNPSAVVNIGRETESHISTDGKITKVTTNPGVNYIKKAFILETGTGSLDYSYTFSGSVGNIKAGFEHGDMSGSMDTTGSFLTPMITTIGLYDDDCQLVAVAKLPKPIKSYSDLPVNFIVRFDT